MSPYVANLSGRTERIDGRKRDEHEELLDWIGGEGLSGFRKPGLSG
jgi:hypothetical protein